MVQIPDGKRYFRIGEASSIIGVEPYVLRYWESEFQQLKPQRADSKQRTYQKKDLETLLEIKRLLYGEKLTIAGAKKRLGQKPSEQDAEDAVSLKEIKNELRDILKTLN